MGFEEDQAQLEQQRGCCGCRGCGCGCLVLLALLVAGGVYAYFYAPGMVVDWFRNIAVKAIEESEIPAEQKQAVIAQVDRLAAAMKEGRLSAEQAISVVRELPNSPVFHVLLLQAGKSEIPKLGLEEEAAEEALLTVQRAQRGLLEEQLTPADLDDAFSHVMTKDENGLRSLKQEAGPEDWRAFLEKARDAVDAAGVPAEEYEVDLGEVVKRFVDKILGEEAPRPEIEPAPQEPALEEPALGEQAVEEQALGEPALNPLPARVD